MTLRFFLSIGVLATLCATSAYAQNRDVRAQRMVLDDNNGNAIIVNTAPGPITGGTLTIPDPAGAGSFLISTPSSGSQSVSGHLLPGTNNSFDLGSSTFRWRNFFLGTNADIGGELRLLEPGGSDYSAFVAQAQANNITYTLPAINGTAGQVLQIASSPAPTATAATLEWGGGAGILYNVSSQQATATPRTNHLFDVAYAATAPDAASTGARISSSAGAAGNNNATALTLVATKTGTGTATALDATGNVNISEGSLLKVGSGGSTINAGGTPTVTTPYSAQISNLVTDFAAPSGANVQKLANLSFSPTANHFIVAQDIRNTIFTIPTGVAIGSGGGGVYPNATLVTDNSTAATGGSIERVGLDEKIITVASTSNTDYTQIAGTNFTALMDGGSADELYGVGANLYVNTGGAVTNSIAGFRADINSSSSTTVAEMYGLNVNLNASTAGVATRAEGINMNVTGDDAVGLRISGVSGYTTSYAIRSDASAQSYFNGNVGIGQLVPTQKLEVRDGNLLLSNGGTEGELRLQEPNGSGTEYTAFKAQAQANNITYTLPAVNGTDGQVLRLATGATATTGTLEWATASGSGWSLTGNAGTTPGTDFLGTTDNTAFEIRVNNAGAATGGNQRVMRYEPGTTSPNIIGGFNGNTVSGSSGSVISGGGSNGAATINSVSTSNFGVIVGGTGNRVVGSTNVIIGAGLNDTITTSNYSVIGGGNDNSIAGSNGSVIPGGNYLKIGSNSFGFNGSSTATQTDLSSTGANFTSVAYFGNANVLIGNVDGTAREVQFYEPNSAFNYPAATNYTAFKAQAQSNNITYTLPATNGTAGQVLRVASTPAPTATAATLEWSSSNLGAVGGLAFARKTANEGVTSSNTLQNDDHLSIALNANEVYELEGVLYVSTTAGGHNLQMALTVPTGTTMKVSYNARQENGATSREADILATSGTAGTVVNLAAANRAIVYVKGLVRTAGTSGNVTLQWADDNTGGTETVTIETDSYFKVTRVQ
ncbi:MAG: hypothetical protein IT211_07400 [Armatimonadetes bacterium]|nr:hypothetical protein [Armatimonadota bacterium]